MEVAILITCNNERDKIISLIQTCYRQIESFTEKEHNFSIYVLDNGSRDFVKEAINEQFPSVKVYRQDYCLQWNNSFRTLWELATLGNHDFYLWLDKDITLTDNALYTMMETSHFLRNKAIIVGNIYDKQKQQILFGGRSKLQKIIIPDEIIPKPVKGFDGKFVLIPSFVYSKIGNIDPYFKLKYADRIYSNKALKNNILMVIAPGIQGIDLYSNKIPKWRNKKYSLITRYRYLNNPNGEPLKEYFIYNCRQSGIFRGIFNYFYTFIKLLFPIKDSQNE